ncbi:beta strand repeat-containing protein, partial [Emticicia fontis]
ITKGTTPDAPVIATTKNALCNNETTVLTATNCTGTVKWSNNTTGTSTTVSTAGTYTATCSDVCGESVVSNPLVITKGSTPTAPIIAALKNALCDNESTTLTATGCLGTVKWSNNATGASITVSEAGTYTATCVTTCGTSAASNAVIITTGTKPTAPIISSDKPSLCTGETATLSATGCSGTVKWSTNATGNSITVTQTGTYSAVCSNDCGNSVSSNVVTINPGSKPNSPVIATTKTSLCNNETTELTATNCTGTVKWNNNATGTSITVSTAGTYTATCTTNCGTSDASNVLTITKGTTPDAPVIATTKNALCNNETTVLTATNCTGTVKWSNNTIGTSTTVSTAGTYTAICSDACGESVVSNPLVITKGSTPTAPIIAALKNALCDNESTTLTATGCLGTVKWSNNATGASITVSEAGTYTATCVTTCGTSAASNAVIITTGTKPTAPIISSDKPSLCTGETATLSATGCSGTVKWSTNATGNSITVTQTGTYSAVCSNDCGNSVSSNVVKINPGSKPNAPVISTTKTSLCNNETTELTATNCTGTVKWNNNATGTSITVSTAGTYTATCTTNCGTSDASNVITITTGTTPNMPAVSTNKTSLCNNETATLTATGCSGTVNWSNGSTGSSINVNTAGTYTATCSNSCGTSGTCSPVIITTGTTPNAPKVASNKTSLCNNETATLTATDCTGTVIWNTNATGTSIIVSTAGTYTATCSNSCGKSAASNVITITIGTTPDAPTIATTKPSLCNNETATLTATGCSGTVKWNTNATGTSITVSTAGTYTATCSNGCGTSVASNVITITTGATPQAPTVTANKTSICGAETATLTATGCTGTLEWSTGATTSSITVSVAGTYSANCKNSCGSTPSNLVVITKVTEPTAPIISADKQKLCGNETATLVAAGCTGTVKWNTGASGSSITVNAPGTYTATCTNACGTSGASNILTIFPGGNPEAPVIATNKTSLCNNETATLTATGCSGTVKWNTNATGTSITVT